MKKPPKPKPRRKSKPQHAPSARRELVHARSLTPLPIAPARAITIASPADDERQLLILLLLPVLLIAGTLVAGQSLKPALRPAYEIAAPALPSLDQALGEIQRRMPALPYAATRPEIASGEITVAALPPIALPAAAPVVAVPQLDGAALPAVALPRGAPEIDIPTFDTQRLAALDYTRAAPSIDVGIPAAGLPELSIANRAPEVPVGRWEDQRLAALSYGGPAPELPPVAVLPPPPSAAIPQVCEARPAVAVTAALAARSATAAHEDFGARIAAAARAQLDDLVIYTARYQRMAYPLGDVPALYGACTDVVIRAYRALGVDLQALVQRSGVGSGDTNIDHRRTETLRRFFARHAESLAVSEFPEDYKPGDIVTYYRPFSRVSRAHIAIVSDVLAPTGRPMIIHNRGWGPQLEDALFVDKITGHYRFTAPAGLPPAVVAEKPKTRPIALGGAPRTGAGDKASRPPVARAGLSLPAAQ